MKLTSALLATLTLISAQALAATVYKYTDEQGNTVFTDEPVKGAEELDVKPVPTIPAIVPKTTAPAPTTNDQSKDFSYNKITIILPSDGEHFINNGGNVSVQVALSPAMRKNDKLQLIFNGSPYGEPQSTNTFQLENVSRGEYVAEVVAINNKGKEVGRSESITFYIKRSAIPQKAPR